MASIEELRKIYLLETLSDEMIDKIVAVSRPIRFGEKDVVFEQGQKAEFFYLLKSGKILLEVEIAETITLSLGTVKSGYSFGWSSLFSGSSHTSYAVCAEPCEVLAIPGGKLRNLLDEDHAMGYLVMEFAARVLKNRLERRTEQLQKLMANHPDMKRLLEVQ